MISKTIKGLTGLLIGLSFLIGTAAQAGHFQNEPVELLIDFSITGELDFMTGQYVINGPGFAPWYIFRSGEIIDVTLPWREVASLEGGRISFTGNPTDPVVRFTCEAGSCNIHTGGSTFTSDAGIPLEGRAVNLWGPVFKSPDFVPDPADPMVPNVAPIRILGCGGLKDISGTGKYAGMVGSICFNGVLNFDKNDQTVLTGSSKCTITLHTPAPGVIIP